MPLQREEMKPGSFNGGLETDIRPDNAEDLVNGTGTQRLQKNTEEDSECHPMPFLFELRVSITLRGVVFRNMLHDQTISPKNWPRALDALGPPPLWFTPD